MADNGQDKSGQEYIDIVPHGFSHDGRAVGRLPDGPVVFVRGGLPGRRVRVHVENVKKRLIEGVAEATLAPAPNERPAPCIHAEECGGCPWQCLPYADQLAWKLRLVRDALDRIGNLRDVELAPVLPSPAGEWNYRNKMEFAFAPGPRLGLRRRASRDVADVTECRLQTPLTMRLIAALRGLAAESGLDACPAVADTGPNTRPALRQAIMQNDDSGNAILRFAVIRETQGGNAGGADHAPGCLVEIITNETAKDSAAALAVRRMGEGLMRAFPEVTGFIHSVRSLASDVAYGERTLQTLGTASLTEILALNGRPTSFQFDHRTFFQVNTKAAELLYNTALPMVFPKMAAHSAPQEAAGPAASPFSAQDAPSGGVCWDLYSGVGGLALTFAPYFDSVLGLESVEATVALARRNAAPFANCRFERADAGRLGEHFRRRGTPDLLVADPPRAGLAPEAVKALLRTLPPQLLLVSCDPATLARDLALLAPAYAIGRVQPVDLFPQTPHVECLVALHAR